MQGDTAYLMGIQDGYNHELYGYSNQMDDVVDT
jgi:hypothetical protein